MNYKELIREMGLVDRHGFKDLPPEEQAKVSNG